MKKPLVVKGQMIEGVFFLVLAIIIAVMSLQLNTFGSWALAPGLFPLIMSVILAILGSSLTYEGIKKSKEKQKESSDSKINWIKVLLVFAMTLAFVWVLPYFHFVISTIIYMTLMLLLLGERRWWVVSTISLGTTGFIYYVFGVLLSVLLP